jgi:transposase-like protein
MECILIAVVDGLKRFPEAITTVFPLTSLHTCIQFGVCRAVFHGIKEEDQFTQGKWTLRHPLRCPSSSRNWGPGWCENFFATA